MQVHTSQVNRPPKVIASLAQRLSLVEKKVEQLQSAAGATFTGPVTAQSTLLVDGTTTLAGETILSGGIQSPASTLTGVVPIGGVDTTAYTFTGSTFTQICNAWPIPVGDSTAVNTAYRLKAFGTATIGATATILGFQLQGFSNGFAATGVTSLSSNSLGWWLEGTMVIVSSTTAHFELVGGATLGSSAGGRSGTSSIAFNGNSLSGTITAGTATTMYIVGAFGTPGTGTTMSCNFSTFERI